MPSSNTKKGTDFEKVIATIQRKLAPDAKVIHDYQKKGKSGIRRKLDVAIIQNIGPYPMLIYIDGKHFNKPVPVKEVVNVADIRDDVNAGMAILISSVRFTKGARL